MAVFLLLARFVTVLELLFAQAALVDSTLSSDSTHSGAVPAATQCDVRTINYITHTLPQLCLTSTWSSSERLGSDASNIDHAANTQPTASSIGSPESGHGQAITSSAIGDSDFGDTVDASTAPFMSFEDWKDLMIKRNGHDPQGHRRPSDQLLEQNNPNEEATFLGWDEGDHVPRHLAALLNPDQDSEQIERQGQALDSATNEVEEVILYEEGKAALYRSKDAGKTCKERFSYSSFDAGATVLKTGPDTKNAKAILVENKDTYMLLECSSDQKFVIVELSDDILVDTVVLANFEFFSSMIRHFRLSVSDRYPVKAEKWRDLGTFEARNFRDIQPFLVENPQIWAKYIRIEFLTHYGKEYYCPISLLRIHGSRMLDSWKDVEASADEDAPDQEAPAPESGSLKATRSTKAEDVRPILGEATSAMNNTVLAMVSSDTCPAIFPQSIASLESQTTTVSTGKSIAETHRASEVSPLSTLERIELSRPDDSKTTPTSNAIPKTEKASTQPQPRSTTTPSSRSQYSAKEPIQNSTSSTSMSSSASSTSIKSRVGSATASGNPMPTVQEGFFNAINKRLQQVESNLTLSLQYVEDHSRYLQDALLRVEQKQTPRISGFLDQLNQTVLTELTTIRDQYDQIWQSTIIALETQRERSERDIVALSARLNILADEVVFQKRMAIAQAILLLSCLCLVIFSRNVPFPYLSHSIDYSDASVYDPHGRLLRTRPMQLHNSSNTTSLDERDTLCVARTIVPRRNYSNSHPPEETSANSLRCASTALPPAEEPNRGPNLSPPNTPRMESGSSSPDPPCQGERERGSLCVERSTLPSRHTRKPLPALPEDPSSP